MKKLLSLLLALVLTLSLAAPALAEEAQEPYWKSAGYDSLEALLADDWADSEVAYYAYLATPAERSAFVAAYRAENSDESAAYTYDAAYAQYLDSSYTIEEVMEALELTTQAQLDDLLFCLWLEEQGKTEQVEADWTALQREKPEQVALFLSQVDQYLADEWGYNSMDEFMTLDFSSVEEAYLYLFDNWNASYQNEREAIARRNALLSSMGGVPGQMNVMAGRRCLSFGDKAPKLVDGTLSVPADVLEKALGTPVKGDAEGYAPLRSSAEGAGWDVLWDQDYQTAILLDGAAIAAQLDKNFTQLNTLGTRLLKAFQSEAGQSYHTQSELAISFTLFDSLNGDKTYDLHFQGDIYRKDAVFSGTFTMDLSSLMGLVTTDQVKQLFGQNLSLSKLTGLVKDCTIEFISNPETDTLYLKMPLLAQLMDGQVPALGQWISIPMADYTDVLDQSAGLSIGAAIYQQTYQQADGWEYMPIGFYGDLDRLTQSYATLLGNDRFTEQSGALTYRLDTQTANGLWKGYMADQGGWYGEADTVPDLFRSCDITLTVGQSGKITAKADVRLDRNLLGMADYYSYFTGGMGDFQAQMDLARTTESLKAGLDLHWQNRFSFTMTETDSVQKTDTAPLSIPPQGAEITPFGDLSTLMSEALSER